MLKSLNIKNFKSFKDATLELSDFTLMIGANASGKSNAIEALQYVSASIDNETRSTINDALKWYKFRGRNQQLKYNELEPTQFIAHIEDYDMEHIFTYDYDINKHHNTILKDDKIVYQDKQFAHYQEILYKEKQFDSSLESDDTTMIEHLCGDNLFFSLHTIVVNSSVSKMREYATSNGDGDEATLILHDLCNSPEKKKIILDTIQSLPEQDIMDIDFIKTERDEYMIKLIERFGNSHRAFDAEMLSDGTLRLLSILAHLLHSSPKYILVIEDIDSGIHPARIKNFILKIRSLAKKYFNGQILMTSHNPALLDAMPLDTLEDVVCCYRDKEEGDSRLVRLGDLYQYPELIAQGTLGELVTDGIVDKFVHDKRTEEEIVQENVDWLKDFKKRQKEAYNEK